MKCNIMKHFIWVLTVCQRTYLGVTSGTQNVNSLPSGEFCMLSCCLLFFFKIRPSDLWWAQCNGQFFPSQFFPGERMGRPILSPGKKLTSQFFPLGKDLTSQFFPHPVSFFSPCYFFGKGLKMIYVSLCS